MMGKAEPSSPNLFIDNSFTQKFNTASKNEKEVLTKELEAAKKLSNLGYKVEMNYDYAKSLSKDTDIIFEGKPAQLKEPVSFNNNSLSRQLDKNQADIIIISLNTQLPDMKRALGKVHRWLLRHTDKKVFLIEKYNNNNISEVKK